MLSFLKLEWKQVESQSLVSTLAVGSYFASEILRRNETTTGLMDHKMFQNEILKLVEMKDFEYIILIHALL